MQNFCMLLLYGELRKSSYATVLDQKLILETCFSVYYQAINL